MKISSAVIIWLASSAIQLLGAISPVSSQVNMPSTTSQSGEQKEAHVSFNDNTDNDAPHVQTYITILTFLLLMLPGYWKYQNLAIKGVDRRQNISSKGFKKRGDDLQIDITLGFFEAVLGVQKEITISRLEIGLDKKVRKVIKSLKVRIPAGGEYGSRLRFRGYGNASVSGGEAGDLYARLLVPSHNRELKRHGINIESEIKLTEEKAQAGCTFIIRTIEGDREIVVSPRTRNGDSLVLKGCGVPQFENPAQKGDHIIHFRVQNMIKTQGENLRLDLAIEFHEAIFGGVKKIQFPHLEADSKGHLQQVNKSLEIMIPAGVDSGTNLRIEGQGDASTNGGEAGDLYLHLHVPSQCGEFNRCGMNINSEIKLTHEQAQLGCDFVIKMLAGEKKIAISAETKDGDFLTLKSCGVPKFGDISAKGDHIIHFCVEPEQECEDIWR
jgi:DnaJ-class molecular chaperone